MPGNISKLQYANNKQFKLTIPKSLVYAKGLKKGVRLQFLLGNSKDLILKKVSGKNESSGVRLQFPNNNQFMVTVPKSLVFALSWKKGDSIEFLLDSKSDFILRKVKKGGKKR